MKKIFSLMTAILVCAVFSMGQNILTEDFEGEFPSNGWTVSPSEAEYYNVVSTSGRNNSSCLEIEFSDPMYSDSEIWIISPQVRVTEDLNTFSFYMMPYNYFANGCVIEVYVSENGNTVNDFNQQPVLSIETDDLDMQYTQYNVGLENYENQNIYIAIKLTGLNSYIYYYIDDITGPLLAGENDGEDNGDNNDDSNENIDCQPISELPYSEDFNNVALHEFPACWHQTGYLFYGDMSYPTTLSNGYMNTNWLAFMDFDGGNTMIASMPELEEELGDVSDLKISFSALNYGNGDLIIGVMTDPEDIQTFEAVDTINDLANNVWTDYQITFSEYEGQGRYISFRAGYPYNDETFVGIDNVVLDYNEQQQSIDTVISEITWEICQTETFDFHGQELSEEGTYTYTEQTDEHTVTIEVLNLTVNLIYETNISATVNPGETYNQDGFNVSTAGTYTITLESINGCDSVVTLELEVNSSLSDTRKDISFSVFPNPARENFTLTIENNTETVSVILKDALGKTVYYGNMSKDETNRIINTENLSNGVYYIIVKEKDKQTIRKLIVKHQS